jgi:hypothetical protein
MDCNITCFGDSPVFWSNISLPSKLSLLPAFAASECWAVSELLGYTTQKALLLILTSVRTQIQCNICICCFCTARAGTSKGGPCLFHFVLCFQPCTCTVGMTGYGRILQCCYVCFCTVISYCRCLSQLAVAPCGIASPFLSW